MRMIEIREQVSTIADWNENRVLFMDDSVYVGKILIDVRMA